MKLAKFFSLCLGFVMTTIGLVSAAPLTPEEAVERAISVSPELRRARSLSEAEQAYSKGAGAQPNPVLRLSATEGDAVERSNSLVQRLEIAGQPGLRGRAAEQTALAALASEQALKRNISRETAEAYYELWENSRLSQVAKAQLELARQLENIAAKRLKLGQVSPHEHLRAKMLLVEAQAALSQAQGEQQLAQQDLALRIGQENLSIELPEPTQAIPSAPEFRLPDKIYLESLLDEDSNTRPELEAARRLAEASRLRAKLAGRAGAPELQLSAYRSNLAQTAQQGLQLSLVVPLFDWGRLGAETAKKKKLAEATEHEIEIVRRRILSEIQTAKTRYEVAFAKRQALREQALQYLALSQTAQQGYQLGLLSLVEVLDAQKTYQNGLKSHIRGEAEFQRARLALWWATGRPFFR